MTVKKLTEQTLDAFKAYCREHRYEHDESYLYEEDLDELELNTGKHPTWLLQNGDTVTGALSLLLDDYFFNDNKARVRIFHCVSGDAADYRTLFAAMEGLPESIRTIEMFLPNERPCAQAIVKDMGFVYHRTSYVMVRKNKSPETPSLPAGYTFRSFVCGEDEKHYANIRNTAFRHLKGSESPLTREQIIKLTTGDELLADGIQLLCYESAPIGLVRVEEDESPAGRYGFIAPIALLPEHQSKGLGTQLLRAGIAVSERNGLPDTMLCVNAENEQALGLYRKNGFTIDESVSCLHYAVHV